MQRFIKSLTVIGFLAIGALGLNYAKPAVSPLSSIKFEDSLKSAANSSARQTYLNNCARCHGADGKSNTELGRMFESPDITTKRVKKMSTARLTRIISRGNGGMPAFGQKLSKKDISGLVGYIRRL